MLKIKDIRTMKIEDKQVLTHKASGFQVILYLFHVINHHLGMVKLQLLNHQSHILGPIKARTQGYLFMVYHTMFMLNLLLCMFRCLQHLDLQFTNLLLSCIHTSLLNIIQA